MPELESLLEQIQHALPDDLTMLQNDLEKNLRAALYSTLRRLDLVSRDEFEVQRQLLETTQERLHTMEQRVQVLEQQLAE